VPPSYLSFNPLPSMLVEHDEGNSDARRDPTTRYEAFFAVFFFVVLGFFLMYLHSG
jgi:hypothetical protein